VSAVEQNISGSTRLGGDYYVAEDGARQQLGFYDSQKRALCSAQLASDGAQRCLPQTQTVDVIGLYANASCTQPAAEWPSAYDCGDAGPGPYALRHEYDGGTCNGGFERVFSVGATLGAGSLFTTVSAGASSSGAGSSGSGSGASGAVGSGSAVCVPAGTSGWASYVTEGAEQPPSSFVAIPTAPLGKGRLVLSAFTPAAADGHPLPIGDSWHDTTLGVDCHFATAADGVQRCIPFGADVYYSDSGCTQVVAVRYDGCPTPFAKYAVAVDSSCPAKSHVYPVASALAAAPAYQLLSGMCLTSNAPMALYSLGPEVAGNTLATATLVTD
jgi:hypothetical protein